ncbi:uncharacterized protein LOC122078340 [Macadamia integrifolia]|uniref:uncharacterized protein LOC122078340 n=1 Tax=Macadamia integrifolia TaxID=60698 RepID=UPI001C4E2FA5|nr:uncharacterized protein LOC122078340 [Macadamia integrifolia]
MGLYTYCFAGGAFALIGAWEALVSAHAHLNPSSSTLSSPDRGTSATTTTTARATGRKSKTTSCLSSVSLIAVAVLSFLFILNSLVSLFDAIHTKDRVGFAVQLEIAAIASLFLLYSVSGFLVNFSDSISFPSSLISLIALFAFGQEFLFFYLQRKDPDGIENRYFNLVLLPIGVCFLSTLHELALPKSLFPSLARGIALILQGTWFVQMGFSFFSNLIAQGCKLNERSKANYTVNCKGHLDYHRGGAISTLQFNCHLAFLVVLIVGAYSFLAAKYGIRADYATYKPLGAELQKMDDYSRFTLDYDGDEDEEIKEEKSAEKQKVLQVASKTGINGFGVH